MFTVFSCELYFMCIVGALFFHCSQNLHEHSFFVCFCYPDMTQLHVLSDPVALYSWGFVLSVLLILSYLCCLLAMLLCWRCSSFHLQDVVTKHSKFAFLYSGLRPEKNLTKQQN